MNTNKPAAASNPLHSSLLHTLFAIINEGNVGDSAYVLAHYFLEHYGELRHLNIFDVASDCFVSRSSVRRFCKAIGYDNFVDLKAEFARYDQVYYANIQSSRQERYKQQLFDEIEKMIRDVSSSLTDDMLRSFVDRIHASRYTVFLIPGAYSGAVKDFQEKMLAHNRIVYVVFENYMDNELIRSLDERDLLITLSVSGVFAEEAAGFTESLNVRNALITGNRAFSAKERYDELYYLSERPDGRINTPVYSRYGVTFMLDVLYSEYARTHQTNLGRN
ncbi:MurR/RpiR family transcriptional regulator [Saccharibacillus sp. CPCC 101409]|uniref:MurR/RpiR family transcriptional regulator n=1 Tax=Saccharibacillus sp. CPCC 101409 TaxID=3058041 RepID=UPI0026722CC7|nr:MurR/RpiR family transcriptional regulator [Saccharibacillus sp. CPCC 101409]MDO3410955.1 MurR/RpiR family transcriptional regulator [Saccharibacillus sp. CPCC 101409]